jgi:rSAM/selenodomain-associated transferase 1
MTLQLLVMAKVPVPGRVKTRLCPPATPESAARIAAAALADTLDAVAATPATRRVLVLSYPDGPAGSDVDGDRIWRAEQRPGSVSVVLQRGDGLAERLANAYADTAHRDLPTLLVGMDTPQVTPALLSAAAERLATADAVLGMAADGGWWALGLRDVTHAEALRGVPMSTPDTGRLTRAALERRGLSVAPLPVLSDVDTAADAWEVGAACPAGRFRDAVTTLLPGSGADATYRNELTATGSGGLS